MQVRGDDVDCFLAHLTTLFRMVTKFCNSDIVSLASSRGILEHLLWYFLYARTFTKSWCSVGMFMADTQIVNS